MLLHIPGVLSGDEVARFRAELHAADWVDGRETVGPQGARVKHNRQLPSDSPLAERLGRQILAALGQHPLYVAAALPLRSVPPLFNRYAGGEHYGDHIDGGIRALPAGGMLRTDLSSTLFLSEPHEYDGGELVVSDTYGVHEVKLPAGDLILYPASSVHRVEPVSGGERLCAFFWTQSMVRNDQQRTMLFELDTQVQALRRQLGDSPEVVSLTGHYHNLLRMWSEL
ncbi:Fe2+-dependent dioxygenase [Chitinimonas sp.]|uniref:Fe2+-dependent dioxygenase n=1 Tax=Chitinimonas sp. TaxID=1934313 RepID=UPI0035B4C61F